jgi:peptidoglycan/LPS O-acetylase OafA/YrhL
VKRLARIVPLYWLSLGLYYRDLRCAWQEPGCTPLQKWALALHPIFLKGWIPYYGTQFFWVPQSWSLEVEMFCYAFFPFLSRLLTTKKAWRPWIVLVCVLLTTIPWFATSHSHRASFILYVYPLARAPEFVLGVVTGCYFLEFQQRGFTFDDWCLSRGWSSWIQRKCVCNAALVLLLAWNIGMRFVFPFSHTIPSPVSILVCVWMFGLLWARDDVCLWIFTGPWARPWVYLGEISYAFYLIHEQLLWRMRDLLDRSDPFAYELSFWFNVLLFGACVGLASALHFLVENPLYDKIVSCLAPCHERDPPLRNQQPLSIPLVTADTVSRSSP